MALVKIISGEINSGKTSLAIKLANEYRRRGERVGGFLSVSETKEKDCYFFKDIETGRLFPSVAKCPPADEDGWKQYDFSRFYFSDTAFRSANLILKELLVNKPDDSSKNPGIVFVDEIGPLELMGKGCIKSVRRLIREFNGTVIIVIREGLLTDFIDCLGLNNPEILRPDQAQ